MTLPSTNEFAEVRAALDSIIDNYAEYFSEMEEDDLAVASVVLNIAAEAFDNGTLYTRDDEAVLMCRPDEFLPGSLS